MNLFDYHIILLSAEKFKANAHERVLFHEVFLRDDDDAQCAVAVCFFFFSGFFQDIMHNISFFDFGKAHRFKIECFAVNKNTLCIAFHINRQIVFLRRNNLQIKGTFVNFSNAA